MGSYFLCKSEVDIITKENYEDINQEFPNCQRIFPWEVISNAIKSCRIKFQSCINKNYVIGDFNAKESFQVYNYLNITDFFFEIDSDHPEITASAFLSLEMQGNEKFIAMCDDYNLWCKFNDLCGNSKYLYVMPHLSKKLPIFLTTQIFAFIIDSAMINSNQELVEKLSPFYLQALQASIRPVFDFGFTDMSEVKPFILKTRNFIDSVNSLTINLYKPFDPRFGFPISSYFSDTFSTDKVKYLNYQLAMKKAKASFDSRGSPIVIAIAFANQGKLVDIALDIGFDHIYVVEQSSAALQLARIRCAKDWGPRVTVFDSFELPVKKVDIIVFDLLGHFGCSALLPEYMATCEHLLCGNSDDNHQVIVIPKSYKSYVVPLMSQYLWNKATQENRFHFMSLAQHSRAVYMAKPQVCFEFEHPGKNRLTMSKRIEFEVPLSGKVHGFGGFFSCLLFDGVEISTSPQNCTKKLSAWYPTFFPLEEQIRIAKKERLVAYFGRKSDKTSVWYEWAVIKPFVTEIQNSNGKNQRIPLSCC